MSTLTLIPAYGRDYRSGKAAIADFEAGRDFTIADISSPYNGSYIDIGQAREAGIVRVNIRFNALRGVVSTPIRSVAQVAQAAARAAVKADRKAAQAAAAVKPGKAAS